MKSPFETEFNCDFETLDLDQRLTVIRTFAESHGLTAKGFVLMNHIIAQSTRELEQRIESASDAADIKAILAKYIGVVDEYTREFSEIAASGENLIIAVLALSGFKISNPFPTVQ